MLSSIWHDPAIDREGQPFQPKGLYDHTLGRLTHAVDRLSHRLGQAYQVALGWSLRHTLTTLGIALATLVGAIGLVPLLGTEFAPKADFSETSIGFYTPAGSSLALTEQRTPRWTRSCVRCPRCATRWPPSTPAPRRGATRSPFTFVWSTGKSASAMSTRCRCRCASAWPMCQESR
jgi:hypothetical protein